MIGSRWALALSASVLLAGGVAGCTRSSTPVAGRITVDGQAEISRPGEDRRELTGSRGLEVGDRVRMLRGTAVIRLPDDRRLELRLGTDVELSAVNEEKQVRPELIGGDLLVVSDDTPLAVRVASADVAVRPLLESVVTRWKSRVDDKHPITRRTSRHLPEVTGDRRLLERCLDELVDNAVKFSPAGAVSYTHLTLPTICSV